MISVRHTKHSALAGTEQRFALDVVRFGRNRECEVCFDSDDDASVSGWHLEARLNEGRVSVRDTDSKNGTFVNGARIEAETHIEPHDRVRLGRHGPEFQIGVVDEHAPKRGVGTGTLARVIGQERARGRRVLALVVAGLVFAGGAIAYFEIREQRELARAVVTAKLAAERALADAAAARSEFERSLELARSQHAGELAALAGQVSDGESRVAALIVEIANRDAALAELERKAESATTADRALERELEAKLRELRAGLAAQEALLREQEGKLAPDWPALVERYESSLFLCLGQSEPDAEGNVSIAIGTAWVCRADGILATNAHVAEFLADAASWKILTCVQNRTGRPFGVREVLLHPEWDHTPDSPDVALVRIDTEGASLVPLPLSDENELRRLRIGTQVGTIGYPGELMSQYVAAQASTGELIRAQATFKDGWIGRILDFRGGRAPFETSFSIQHSASLSGGTSGSPMFTKDGHVVALHNAGTDFYVRVKSEGGADERTERLSSPAQIGWAVRADLLAGLLAASGW